MTTTVQGTAADELAEAAAAIDALPDGLLRDYAARELANWRAHVRHFERADLSDRDGIARQVRRSRGIVRAMIDSV